MEDFNLEFSKNIDYILQKDIIINFTPSGVCDVFLKKIKNKSSGDLLLLLSQFNKINNNIRRYDIVSKLLLNYVYITISVQCKDPKLFNRSRKSCIIYWGELIKYLIDDH
jgi:hypothetical protein